MPVFTRPYETDLPMTKPGMGREEYVHKLRVNRQLHAAENSFKECILSIAEQLIERKPDLDTMDVVEQSLHSCSYHSHPIEMSIGGKPHPRLPLYQGFIPKLPFE